MKKFLSILGLFTILVPKAEADSASAFSEFCGLIHAGGCSYNSAALAARLACHVGSIIAWVVGGGAVLVIIYGSIRLIASAGNDSGKEDAKKIITAAIIGLLLAIAAEGIILFVYNFFNPGSSLSCS